MKAKATEKQVRYALMLLRTRGFSVRYMNAEYKKLGATMRERSGMVSDWLEDMNTAQISGVIETPLALPEVA